MSRRRSAAPELPVVMLPLAAIAGVDPWNVRAHEPEPPDTASLQATIAASGLINPLTVRASPADGPDRWRVLAGRRRWHAITALRADGRWTATTVPARVFKGAESDARILSLGESDAQRLHPVTEAEAFRDIAASGATHAQIAAASNRTVRDVRRKVALGSLSDRVRAAWRAAAIGADEAAAFALDPRHARQDAVLDLLTAGASVGRGVAFVREQLRISAVRLTEGLARFVGVEAYEAAGGEIDARLWDEETWLLDGHLLRQLAREKMTPVGNALCVKEGWGHWDWREDLKEEERGSLAFVSPDWLPGEEARLAELDGVLEDAAATERDLICARAVLRACGTVRPASLGVLLDVDDAGRIVAQRGVRWHAQPAEATAAANTSSAKDAAGEDPPPPPRRDRPDGGRRAAGAPPPSAATPPPTYPTRAARAAVERTVAAVAAPALARRHDLALAVALVALTHRTRETPDHMLGVLRGDRGTLPPLLARMTAEPSARALSIAAAQPRPILVDAIVSAVSMAFDPSDADVADIGALLTALRDAGEPLESAFRAAFAPDRYLLLASRETLLLLFAELDPPAAERKGWISDDKLRERVAAAARATGWLPPVPGLRAPPAGAAEAAA